MRPLILHLSSEYLDPLRPPPITDAVLRLVDRLTDYEQVVISLRRFSDPRKAMWRDLGMVDGRRLIVWRYFAPPLGLGMFARQWLIARRIRGFLAREGLVPDVVHAHRFTFEGIAAWLLARRSGAALLFSVRGEVESKVFRMKPSYRPLFRRMARDARRIYFVSAWFRSRFEQHVGIGAEKTGLLPNIVHNARADIPVTVPERRLVCAMSLRAIDKKGLPELLAAFALAGPALDGVTLDIIGEGPPEAIQRIAGLVARHGLVGRVLMRDRMPNAELLAQFGRALAVVLPSHNETFGMVYPEALFAGTPILYSAGTGIAGYIDDLPVGVPVKAGSVASIAAGLVALVEDNARFRQAISDNAAALFDRFDPGAVLARYRAEIDAVPQVRRDT